MLSFPYYPNSAKYNLLGHLEVGGYDLIELAERFGTPLYILDEQTIRETAREYKQALDEFYPNSLPIFASKALSLQAVFALLNQEGFGLDVVSAGELYTAQSISFPAHKIYLHGNNKSVAEIEMACDLKEAKIIIDNFSDLEILKQLNKPASVLIRLTPGVECHTHDYIKTGHLDSKFGFDPQQLDLAIEEINKNPNLNLLGLHSHIGSQIFETLPFQDAARILLEKYQQIKQKYGLELEELNLGGGIGIHYTAQDDPPAIRDIIRNLATTIKSLVSEFGLKEPKLILEPGRSLVGRAGVTLYKIGASKQVPQGKSYLSVDGGMADNPRPITYQAKYSAQLANRLVSETEVLKTFTIAGRYCESGDVLIESLELPESTNKQDLLVVFGTGAYNYAMSSNYNRVPKPAMVLVGAGEAEIILQRETLEDLLRNDVLPSRLLKDSLEHKEAIH